MVPKIWKTSWWAFRLTRIVFKWRYVKFILRDNTEWDWSSIVELLDLKFSTMGYVVWNWGVASSSKESVHMMWRLRKSLRDLMEAGDRAQACTDREFKERFGFDYRPKMTFTDRQAEKGYSVAKFEAVCPEGTSQKVKDEVDGYLSVKAREGFALENEYAERALGRFCKHFRRDLRSLWD